MENSKTEIAAVEIPQRGGDPLIDSGEGVRPGTSAESLANLRPAFAADGRPPVALHKFPTVAAQ